MIDGITENTNEQHEYVGRLLIRMSVTPLRDYIHPRLISVPCMPTMDPEGEEYVLSFAIYSASEIPVMGGKLRVEVVFGPDRLQSKWVHGVVRIIFICLSFFISLI